MRYCPLEESNVPSARGCSEWELHSARKRNNIDLLLEHTVLQPKTQHLIQVGIIAHADR